MEITNTPTTPISRKPVKSTKPTVNPSQSTSITHPSHTGTHTSTSSTSLPQGSEESVSISGDATELSGLLKQFIGVNKNISELKAQIKCLTNTSKSIEEQVLKVMNSNQLQNIDTQNSVIQIKTTTVKKQINQQMLAAFGEHMHIPPPTIKEFLDQLPARTTQSLQIKYK